MKPAVLLIGWAALSVGAFWRYEARYMVPVAGLPAVEGAAKQQAVQGKNTLFIAWSPTCPCSKFENEYIKQLAVRHPKLEIVGLVQADSASEWTALGLPGTPRVDADGKQARALGITATPGSVLVDATGATRFSGSLHAGRFCDNEAVAFANQAITFVEANQPVAVPKSAFFGCAVSQ